MTAPTPPDATIESCRDRRAYRIEDLPDDLAALLEEGLDALRNPAAATDDSDDVIIG